MEEVVVVGRCKEPDWKVEAHFVPDDLPGAGPLTGLLTGLRRIEGDVAVVVACDLPYLSAQVLRFLLHLAPGCEAVVPRIEERAQPLHAVYACSIRDTAARQMAAGRRDLQGLLVDLRVRWVGETEFTAAGLLLRSFYNVNTLGEWEDVLRHAGR